MTPLPIEALAMLDAIAVGEDYNWTDYDELVGGGKFAGFSAFPSWAGKQFPGGISHAAGRYQFEPATWKGQVVKLKLVDFSPTSQDIAAWDLASSVYKARTRRDLLGDLRSKGAQGRLNSTLHSTWTSISSATWDRYCGALAARQMLARWVPSAERLPEV